MSWRTRVRCGLVSSWRARVRRGVVLVLTRRQRWYHETKQQRGPLPQHLFNSRSAIHYRLLTTQPCCCCRIPKNTAAHPKLRVSPRPSDQPLVSKDEGSHFAGADFLKRGQT